MEITMITRDSCRALNKHLYTVESILSLAYNKLYRVKRQYETRYKRKNGKSIN